MNTKMLGDKALKTIDQYKHFQIGKAVSSVPYFNNKVTRSRASIRTLIGKGSPKDIQEEVMTIIIKNHVDQTLLADESLKKILTDNNIGIDCSGFVYNILNAECQGSGKGSLDKYIHFTGSRGILGKIRSMLRPVENCDVKTFADNKNSSIIKTGEIIPGDMITMIGGPDEDDRDHILLIYKVDYQDSIPTKIFYTHAIAYPEDGIYGTGIKMGTIEITDRNKDILTQRWLENDKEGAENVIFTRAQKSNTEVRRVNI